MDDHPPFIVVEREPPRPLDKPIHLSGAITPNDFFRSQQMYRRGTFAADRLAGTVLGICVGIAICYFFATVHPEVNIYVIIFALVGLFAFLLNLQLQAYRNSKRRLGPFAQFDIEISEEGIKIKQKNCNSEILWAFYKFYLLSDLFVILVEGYPKNYRILPRRLFQNDDDWKDFTGLLSRKLTRR